MEEGLLTNDTETLKVADGKIGSQIRRMHDMLIFLGGMGQRELVAELDNKAFTIFTSDNPVFMPAKHANAVNLRLDSNIIFIDEDGSASYKLIDIFAVKGGPPIRIEIGEWNLHSHQRTNGFHLRNLVSAISPKTPTRDIRCLI